MFQLMCGSELVFGWIDVGALRAVWELGAGGGWEEWWRVVEGERLQANGKVRKWLRPARGSARQRARHEGRLVYG